MYRQGLDFKEALRFEIKEHEKAIERFNVLAQMAPNSWLAQQIHIMNNYHKDEAWRLANILHLLEYTLLY